MPSSAEFTENTSRFQWFHFRILGSEYLLSKRFFSQVKLRLHFSFSSKKSQIFNGAAALTRPTARKPLTVGTIFFHKTRAKTPLFSKQNFWRIISDVAMESPARFKMLHHVPSAIQCETSRHSKNCSVISGKHWSLLYRSISVYIPARVTKNTRQNSRF